MNRLVYTKEYQYTDKYQDNNHQITPWAILDIFQDIAGEHVKEFNYGFSDMFKRGLIWVLVRTKYEVIEYPTPLNKILVVTTWQSIQGRADFTRDYLIKSIDGKELIKGTSKWVLLDINSRKIVSTSILEENITYSAPIYLEGFPKLKFDCLINEETIYIEKVDKIKIDHNNHLNNARYLEIISNALKLKEKIETLEINYIKEAFLDDIIMIKKLIIDKEIFVEGYREEELIFKCKIKLK